MHTHQWEMEAPISPYSHQLWKLLANWVGEKYPHCPNWHYIQLLVLELLVRPYRQFFFLFFFFFFRNHSDCVLSLLLFQRKRRAIINGYWQLQKQHQKPASHSGESTAPPPRGCRLYTFRETSLVTNCRHDP